AIDMKHWQRPQVSGLCAQPGHQHLAERMQISTTMTVDDPLGSAGGARCKVDCDRTELRFQGLIQRATAILTFEACVILQRPGPHLSLVTSYDNDAVLRRARLPSWRQLAQQCSLR